MPMGSIDFLANAITPLDMFFSNSFSASREQYRRLEINGDRFIPAS
jgi:hypothetical protein